MSYRQLGVKYLPKVPLWRLGWGSNLRPCGCEAPNLPPYLFLKCIESEDVITRQAEFKTVELDSVSEKQYLSEKLIFSIQFNDHFYSPPLSKVHYGRALYSSHKTKNRLTTEI